MASVPIPSGYQYLTQSGVIVADTADVLAEVQAEYIAAFGAELNLDPSTPQGVLITAEVLARTKLLRSNADLANQINPNLAGGGFLDAICALTGLQRTPAAPTLVPGVLLTGIPGAIINAGSRAKTSAGDLFEAITTVQLDWSGNGAVDFQSVVSGPIPCSVNDLSTIVDNVLGWETVDNPNAATIGQATQSDAALRVQRKKTLGLQGVSISEAIISRVNNVVGVQSLQFLENVAATTQTISGVSLVANSIWVCVQGGLDADIGLALLLGKSCGAAWNGSTNVTVKDPASKQNYTVSFDRPTPVTIWVKATVKQITPVANVTDSVTNAILTWANNLVDGVTGLTVGNSVSPFEIAAAIVEQVSGIYVQKLEVSNDGSTWQTTEYAIAINEVGSIVAGHISVVLA